MHYLLLIAVWTVSGLTVLYVLLSMFLKALQIIRFVRGWWFRTPAR